MTTLAEVLAENWRAFSGEILVPAPGTEGRGESTIADFGSEDGAHLRSNVAVLGQRALAMILRWEAFGERCPVCQRYPNDPSEGHNPGCVWGTIVAEARALR